MLEIKEIEPCKMQVHYSADADVVKNKRKDLIKMFKKYPVSGFRKGKATPEAVYLKYKKQIEEHLKQEMVSNAVDDVVFETKAKVLGKPASSNVFLDGDIFACDLLITKKPDFELGEYKGLKIPKPHNEQTEDELVESMLADLRMRFGVVRPYNESDFIQKNDTITMDCSFKFIGDPPMDDLFFEGETYEVGTSKSEEFDDSILGMKPGEEREFNTKIDARNVRAKVTLHMGMKKDPAELNEEFAKNFGHDNMDDLLNFLRGMATKRLDNLSKQAILDQIKNQLVSSHDFEIPTWLALAEAHIIAKSNNLEYDNMDDVVKQSVLERAKKQIKLSFVLDSIRDIEPDTVLSEAECFDMLKKDVEAQGVKFTDFVQRYQHQGQLFSIIASMKDDWVFQWLMNNAEIIE